MDSPSNYSSGRTLSKPRAVLGHIPCLLFPFFGNSHIDVSFESLRICRLDSLPFLESVGLFHASNISSNYSENEYKRKEEESLAASLSTGSFASGTSIDFHLLECTPATKECRKVPSKHSLSQFLSRQVHIIPGSVLSSRCWQSAGSKLRCRRLTLKLPVTGRGGAEPLAFDSASVADDFWSPGTRAGDMRTNAAALLQVLFSVWTSEAALFFFGTEPLYHHL